MQMISIGRIVFYRLTPMDVAQITRRRTSSASIRTRLADGEWPEGAQAHLGNAVHLGQVVPCIVTACTDDQRLNGQCLLDGTDTFWVQDIEPGMGNGQWSFPPRV